MRRFLMSCLLLSLSMTVFSQDNPIVMHVAGNDISRSEFEYFFFKNNTTGSVDPKILAEYADMYVNFKLKVADAKECGIDTMPNFLREYRQYRNKDADAILINQDWLEMRSKELYRDAKNAIEPYGFYETWVITIIPESEKDEDVERAYERIDSLRELVKSGEEFGDVAYKYSQDVMAKDYGYMGWVARPDVPDFIAEVLFDVPLEDGLSVPAWTQVGWMLFYVSGKKPLEPYEDQKDQIYGYMKANGFEHLAKLYTAGQYAYENGWGDIDDEAALARMDSTLEQIYPDFGNISREYYEGLLLFEISNRRIWNSISSDTLRLQQWFQDHRKEYSFEKPIFKGSLLFCKSEADFNELKAFCEGVSESELPERIAQFNENGVRVHAVNGPIMQGGSSYCDAIVFGIGTADQSAEYPFMSYIGHVTSQPEDWTEMSGQVISDCQDAAEKEWIKSLRKRYSYKIDKKVLKTVGNHD